MSSSPTIKSSQNIRNLSLALVIASPLLVYAFAQILPTDGDWVEVFWPAAQVPFDPYQIRGFLNPPWVALILAPFTLFPLEYAQAFNAFLIFAVTLLIIYQYGGNHWSLLITITAFPFLSLFISGNIDWIPMTAFLIPPSWGLLLFLFKPQVGSMAGFHWLIRAKQRWKLLLPSMILIGISFFIWGFWPRQMMANATMWGGNRSVGPWNVAPWPWLIPVGIWLFYLAWKRNDDLFAVLATICLTPYFALYSFTLFVAMLAARKPYQGLIASAILWAFAMFMRWFAINIYA